MDSTDKFAVALRYDPSKDYVPFVVAKGKEDIAERIIEIAKKEGIPIVKSPKLVQELMKLEVLDFIPNKLYVAVAQVLAFVETVKNK